MSYSEELLKLRRRVADAVNFKVFDAGNKDIIEALLIQIMNDAEKNRQQCLSQAENLRKQAATIDGQAGAFASVNSILYNVLTGFVKNAERALEEDKLLAQDKNDVEVPSSDQVSEQVKEKPAKRSKGK
jgi:polyhydroxyalkanoate synthesis regulator protein